MVLVDTSVWVSHLRKGDSILARLLEDAEVECHPFIVGELACGCLVNRAEILNLIQSLPETVEVTHEEILEFINAHQLMGKGLGYIDLHLIASAILSDTPLWTFDKKLRAVSAQLRIAWSEPG